MPCKTAEYPAKQQNTHVNMCPAKRPRRWTSLPEGIWHHLLTWSLEWAMSLNINSSSNDDDDTVFLFLLASTVWRCALLLVFRWQRVEFVRRCRKKIIEKAIFFNWEKKKWREKAHPKNLPETDGKKSVGYFAYRSSDTAALPGSRISTWLLLFCVCVCFFCLVVCFVIVFV